MSGTGRRLVKQQPQGMLRNHQFLVGRYDVNWNTTVGMGYQARVADVFCLIDPCTKPSQLIDDPRPDVYRVFTDSRSEDECVKTLQGSRKHAGVKPDPIDEIIDRQFSLGVATSLQLA